MGAPLPAAPPCILHRRFPRTAGDWHGFPLRVRAPHRDARFMGNFSRCMGLLLRLLTAPTLRGDGTYNRLSTGMDVDVLDCDALLTLAAVTVEGLGQSRGGPGELVRLVQVLAPTFEGLIANHRTPVALHGGVMAREQLPDQHALELVLRLHAHHGGERRPYLLIEIGVLPPQSVNDLFSEDSAEIVVVGAADRPLNMALFGLVGSFSITSLSSRLLLPSSAVCVPLSHI